ncbi:MAG: hypothetical protein ACFFCK_06215, partial [Promethearchaeota archaeon]
RDKLLEQMEDHFRFASTNLVIGSRNRIIVDGLVTQRIHYRERIVLLISKSWSCLETDVTYLKMQDTRAVK